MMASEPPDRKTWTRLDRRVAMLKLGATQQTIADACQCDVSLVSHVIAGRIYGGRGKSRKVMEHIAALTGEPIEIVFPEYRPKTPKAA